MEDLVMVLIMLCRIGAPIAALFAFLTHHPTLGVVMVIVAIIAWLVSS
jgi:hypothetical protein